MLYGQSRATWERLESRTLWDGTLLGTEPWGLAAQVVGLDDVADGQPSLDGTGQTVAIIDTGIDYTHHLLGGGWGNKVVGGYDFVDEDNDPIDTYGHGTRVAGVIAADEFLHEGQRYRGVAPGAKLVALRIDSGNFPVPDERIEDALRWVIDNRATFGITVVNISFGYGHFHEAQSSPVFGDELRELAEANVFIAASSGNNGVGDPPGIQYPAADDNVFAVGSIDSFGTISEFTERNGLLDMLAPGEQIVTTDMVDFNESSEDVAITSGTSFAAPMVAGTVALLRQIDPTLSLGDVRSILRASAGEIQDGDDEFGFTTNREYPLLSIERAVALAESRRPGLLGSTNDVAPGGNNNDLVYDDEGVLHFVYHDSADKKLKYMTRSTDGQWSNPTIVDPETRHTGQYVSLALDSYGRPGVAYFVASAGDLKFARFDGQTWSTATIDSKHSVGLYPSILFDKDDNPVISYYHKRRAELRLARFDGERWIVRIIDGSDDPTYDVGRSGSIAMDRDGRLGISYVNSRTGHVRFARENANGSWTLRTVDSQTRSVAWTSLGLTPSGRAYISYYDADPANLKVARPSGSSWITETVASAGAQGLYSNLLFGADGRVNVVYYNRRDNATMLARLGGDGAWTVKTLLVGGGKFISADFGPDDHLSISWFDSVDRLLHVTTVI